MAGARPLPPDLERFETTLHDINEHIGALGGFLTLLDRHAALPTEPQSWLAAALALQEELVGLIDELGRTRAPRPAQPGPPAT